jgi:hypothetical protein
MVNQICIPKLMCVNTYFIILILLIVLVYTFNMKRNVHKIFINKASDFIENRPQDQHPELYRRMYDRLEQPSKTHVPSQNGIPINIRTRGPEVSFQQVGYLYRDESDPTYNPDEKNRASLYGRPTYGGSSKFEYYVIVDDIKIELSNTSEIYTGDVVSIKGFSGDWNAEIYENKEWKYIPYIY